MCFLYCQCYLGTEESEAATAIAMLNLNESIFSMEASLRGQRSMWPPPLFTCLYGEAIERSFHEGIGSRYDEISGLDWLFQNGTPARTSHFFVAAIRNIGGDCFCPT